MQSNSALLDHDNSLIQQENSLPLLQMLPRKARYHHIADGSGTPDELIQAIAFQLQDMGFKGDLSHHLAPVYTALQNYQAEFGAGHMNVAFGVLPPGHAPYALGGQATRQFIFYPDDGTAPKEITQKNNLSLDNIPQGGAPQMAEQFPKQGRRGLILQITSAGSMDSNKMQGGTNRKRDDEQEPTFEEILAELAAAEWQDKPELGKMGADPEQVQALDRLLRDPKLSREALLERVAVPVTLKPDGIADDLEQSISSKILQQLGTQQQRSRGRIIIPVPAEEQENSPQPDAKEKLELSPIEGNALSAKEIKASKIAAGDPEIAQALETMVPQNVQALDARELIQAVMAGDGEAALKALNKLALDIAEGPDVATQEILQAHLTKLNQGDAIDPDAMKDLMTLLRSEAQRTGDPALQQQLTQLDDLTTALAERFPDIAPKLALLPAAMDDGATSPSLLPVEDKADILRAVLAKDENAAGIKADELTLKTLSSIIEKLAEHPDGKTDATLQSLQAQIAELKAAPTPDSIKDLLDTTRAALATREEFRGQASLLAEVETLRDAVVRPASATAIEPVDTSLTRTANAREQSIAAVLEQVAPNAEALKTVLAQLPPEELKTLASAVETPRPSVSSQPETQTSPQPASARMEEIKAIVAQVVSGQEAAPQAVNAAQALDDRIIALANKFEKNPAPGPTENITVPQNYTEIISQAVRNFVQLESSGNDPSVATLTALLAETPANARPQIAAQIQAATTQAQQTQIGERLSQNEQKAFAEIRTLLSRQPALLERVKNDQAPQQSAPQPQTVKQEEDLIERFIRTGNPGTLSIGTLATNAAFQNLPAVREFMLRKAMLEAEAEEKQKAMTRLVELKQVELSQDKPVFTEHRGSQQQQPQNQQEPGKNPPAQDHENSRQEHAVREYTEQRNHSPDDQDHSNHSDSTWKPIEPGPWNDPARWAATVFTSPSGTPASIPEFLGSSGQNQYVFSNPDDKKNPLKGACTGDCGSCSNQNCAVKKQNTISANNIAVELGAARGQGAPGAVGISL